MQKLVKPRSLPPGGTIGAIAPAGAVQLDKLEEGISWLLKQGYQIKRGKHLTSRYSYLAGEDHERAADIMAMFLDDQVDAIMCARGGYGCMRLLSLLDYKTIRKHPKIFVGYSDITALHAALLQRSGMVSFHGPMVASSLAGEIDLYSLEVLQQIIVEKQLPFFSGEFIHPGEAEGHIIGGNLSIIAALIGTPYELSFENVILCIEEVNEAPYRIDRLLTQLLLSGRLKQAAGIVVGDFEDCVSEDAESSIVSIITERLSGLNVPILTGIHFGHGEHNVTLPLGIKARISSSNGGLAFLELPVV